MTRVVLVALALGACQSLDATRAPADLDRPYFDCKVQPVLTKDCSQLACHGAPTTPGRYFRIYARNRFRDDYAQKTEMTRNAILRGSEREHNYDAARAFVDLAHPEDSLILRKPLETTAGGYFHRGATLYGGANVFADTTDPDYQIIAGWIDGATDVSTCQEPGANTP
jgi:hypothetical protein